MAQLSAASRKRMSSTSFALPAKRMFPINDRAHAEKALQLVSRAQKAGSITAAEAATVRRKARAKLSPKKGGK